MKMDSIMTGQTQRKMKNNASLRWATVSAYRPLLSLLKETIVLIDFMMQNTSQGFINQDNVAPDSFKIHWDKGETARFARKY